MRKKLNALWYGLILGLALIVGVVLWAQKDRHLIYLDNQPIFVDVVKDQEDRALGLSGRVSMEHGRGMLFVFEEQPAGCMWMKDMNFNIDVYWYSKSGELINHRENLSPQSYPTVYCPEIPAKYLLEVASGEFQIAPDRLILTDNL